MSGDTNGLSILCQAFLADVVATRDVYSPGRGDAFKAYLALEEEVRHQSYTTEILHTPPSPPCGYLMKRHGGFLPPPFQHLPAQTCLLARCIAVLLPGICDQVLRPPYKYKHFMKSCIHPLGEF